MYTKNDFKDLQHFTFFLDGLVNSKAEFIIVCTRGNNPHYIAQDGVIQDTPANQEYFNKTVLNTLQYVYLSSDLEYQGVYLRKSDIKYNSVTFSATDIVNDTIRKYTQLLDDKLLLNNLFLSHIPVSSENLFSDHTKDLAEVQPVMQYLVKSSIKIINNPISFSDAIHKIQSLVAREFNRINKALLYYICIADFNIDYILHPVNDRGIVLNTLRIIAGSGKENTANTLRASCTSRYHNLQQNQSTELFKIELQTIRELFCKIYYNAYTNLEACSQFNLHLDGGYYGLPVDSATNIIFDDVYNTKFSIKEIIDRDRKIIVANNMASDALTQHFNRIFNADSYLKEIQK